MVKPILCCLFRAERRLTIRTAAEVLPSESLEKALNSVSFLRVGRFNVKSNYDGHIVDALYEALRIPIITANPASRMRRRINLNFFCMAKAWSPPSGVRHIGQILTPGLTLE